MSAIHDEFFPEFEALGEPEVHRKLKCNELHITKQEPARVWLELREAKAKARLEDRKDKTLALAQEANDIAKEARADASKANKIAIFAIIISVTVAVIIALYTVRYSK